ncbi:MAG: O-antigen translocase, partial [Pseudomonas sp.]
MLGQLMTLVAIVGMFAGGGVTNGLIKVLARTPIGTAEGRQWFASAFTLTTLVSLFVALLLTGFSGVLSRLFMPGVAAMLFVCLALSQMIIAYGNLVLAETS